MFTVTPSAGTGGSLSPATPQTVGYGGTTSFTVTPDTGYSIQNVAGCSGSLVGNTYTTGVITGNCTVTASFVLQSFMVTPSAGTGGSLSPATPQTVGYGGTTSFTVTPDTGYANQYVAGCSGSLLGNTYTTGAITANCTVTANFVLQTFTLTVSANPADAGTLSGGGVYSYGDVATVTATPTSGFAFVEWSGACTGPGACSVSMVSDQSVTANFAPL
jgi:hypothetical protein